MRNCPWLLPWLALLPGGMDHCLVFVGTGKSDIQTLGHEASGRKVISLSNFPSHFEQQHLKGGFGFGLVVGSGHQAQAFYLPQSLSFWKWRDIQGKRHTWQNRCPAWCDGGQVRKAPSPTAKYLKFPFCCHLASGFVQRPTLSCVPLCDLGYRCRTLPSDSLGYL